MGIAKKLYKYIFPWVNVKFSGFPLLLGYIIAVAFGYDGKWLPWSNAPSWLVVLIVFIGDIIGEGVWQHGWDILNDKTGGVSGFRETGSLAGRIAKGMVYASFIIGLGIAAFVAWAGRVTLIPIGLVAFYLAWKYSKRRNEGYAMAAVALAVAAGYFSATNYPSLPLVIAMIIAVIEHKVALALYRYDDYAGIRTWAEFPTPMLRLAYFRELFWLNMWISYLVMLLVLCFMGLELWAGIGLIPVIVGMIQKRRVICHAGK